MRDAYVSELADDVYPDDDKNQHQSFVHVQGPAIIVALVTATRTTNFYRSGEMQLHDNDCKRRPHVYQTHALRKLRLYMAYEYEHGPLHVCYCLDDNVAT